MLVAIAPTDDIEAAVSHEMAPFDENGEWFGEGTRWDWWQSGGRYEGRLLGGNVLRRADVNLDQMRRDERERYARNWREAQERPEAHRGFIYGLEPNEQLDDYLARKITTGFPWFGSFLRNRVWQEEERLGWFGSPAATECESKGHDVHICVHENAVAQSRIVSWNGAENWSRMFFARFVEPRPADTLLVCVDYHV